MRLEDWLTREKETQSGFARRIGCWPQAIDRYLSGARVPNQEMRRKIHGATGGEVTSNDWDGLPEPRPVLVALARPERRGAFERLGWQPWPDPEAAPCGLMCRKARPGEDWQAVVAELAYLTGPAQPAAPPARHLEPGALVAPGIDPD